MPKESKISFQMSKSKQDKILHPFYRLNKDKDIIIIELMIAIEVIPNLWIGDIRSALDRSFLRKYKITAIINCTTKYPFPDHESIKIRVPVRDRGLDEDIDMMYTCLLDIVPTMYDLLSKGERILVHCYAGCHRSVCLVLAFIIKYADMSLREAISLLRMKWPRVGLHFSRSLCRYELNH